MVVDSIGSRAARYNLPAEQALRLRTGGFCDMCGEWTARLAIDHDHGCCPTKSSCGECVRGLVCVACNTALGRFETGLRWLRGRGIEPDAAISYLSRTEALS